MVFTLVLGCGDLTGDIVSLTVTPVNSTIGVSQSKLFTAVAHDSMGQIVSVNVSWGVTGGIGTISSSGLFTATGSAAAGTVYATYLAVSDSSAVTITENGWLEGTITNTAFGILSGITVFLAEDPTLQSISNSSGFYSIGQIPAGSYTAMTVATDTIQSTSTEVTVGRGETVTWNPIPDTQPGTPTIPTTTLFSPILE